MVRDVFRRKINELIFYVRFKTRAAAFLSGFKTMRRCRVVSDQKKHVLRVFLNGCKNIPAKACVKRIQNNYGSVNVGNYTREKYMYKNIIRRRFYWVLKPLHVMIYGLMNY